MTTYEMMKTIINNTNNKLANRTITIEDYELFKTSAMKKLDIFLSLDRISVDNYRELVDLLKIKETI